MRHSIHTACAVVLGLNAMAAWAQTQASTVTRSTEFQYHPTTGLLTLERIDPGTANCVETAYDHDSYGNRRTIEVRPCAGVTGASATFTPRLTTNYFEAGVDAQNRYPAGAYQTRSTTGTGSTVMAESRASYHPAFGTATAQTEVALNDNSKNLSKRTAYDEFGRVLREYVPVQRNADNSVSETSVGYTYNYCQGPQATSPSAACLNFSLSVPVGYASQRLVDSAGVVVGNASVPFITAYFIESTPYGPDNNGTDVIGAKSRVHFDALHREIAKETQTYDDRWVRTLTGYDALGQTAATWGAYFVAASAPQTPPPEELKQWTSARDNLHRPVEQQQYWRGEASVAAVVLTAQVNYNGLETTATVPATSAPNGIARSVITRKNPAGQTAQTVNAQGTRLSMAYDAAGNLVKTVDALGAVTTVSYTAGTARFKTGMVDPDQGAWSYTYDAAGQLKTQTDARGRSITMAYDALGRLTTKSTEGNNAEWYYGSHGNYAAFAGAAPSGICAYGLNRLCGVRFGTGTSSTAVQWLAYDTLARPTSSANGFIGDRVYTSSSGFDTLGRLASTTYPSGFRVNYVYSTASAGKLPGVLERVVDNANSTRVFWRIDTQAAGEVFDAQGHVLKAQLGNGVVSDHRYDAISGKAFNLRAGINGANSNVYDQRYTYDKVNNLASRTEGLSGVVENFAYDVLDRLAQYQVQSASDAGAGRTVSLQYNLAGNIDSKSDVGPYTYNSSVKPHAVRSAGGTNYDYDANGNLTSSTGAQSRTQTWTDFNQPNVLSYQGKSVAFSYDASYKRVKEVTTDGATARTLFLIHPDNAGGLGFEREETRVNGSLVRNESRHYISVGGAVVAVVKTLNSGDPVSGPLNGTVSSDPALTQYWHKDALGSIVTVTNAAASGTVAIERMAFDAWGRRLRATGLVDPAVNPAHGDRGYTGHEHLDELALVHMNGRVYDPVLARFLSPDPMLQSPGDLQNYNRYSYVLNNPLRYTDPSGEFWQVLLAIAGIAMIHDGNKYWKLVGTIALSWALGGADGLVEQGLGTTWAGSKAATVVANNALAGFATGLATSGGDFESAFIGAWTAGAFAGVGNSGLGLTGKVIGHALIGCASQAVSGGKCGPGAMAAAFSKFATAPEGLGLTHIVAATLVGGTASVIGGGKFANGAMTGAMGYVFNELSQYSGSSEDRLRLAGYGATTYDDGTICNPHCWSDPPLDGVYPEAALVPATRGAGVLRTIANWFKRDELTINWGTNRQDADHAIRHVRDAGLSVDKVKEAIRQDLIRRDVGNAPTGGLGGHNPVTVQGVTVRYSGYKLPDGSINVSSIRPPR